MKERRDRFTRASTEERAELADTFARALFDLSDLPLDARRPGAMPDAARPLLAGPTTIRPVRPKRGRGPSGFAVVSRSGNRDSPALGLFDRRDEATLVASVLPAATIENPFTVGDLEPGRGYPVFQDGLLLGHVAHPDTELPARLHLAWSYATNLEALAHLLEGLDARALVFLGRVLARRMEENRPGG